MGWLRGNKGVTELTVWTRSPAFVTWLHNLEETPANWEVFEGRREEKFVTMANSG